MQLYSKFNSKNSVPGNGSIGYPIFTPENSAISGFTCGIGIFNAEEYPVPGVHDDHEGFYVINGQGMAKVGDEEFAIAEGVSFLAPAHVPHAIRKDKDSADMKIFWFHFPCEPA